MDLPISVRYAIGLVIAASALELRRSPDNPFLGLSAYILTLFMEYRYQVTELEAKNTQQKDYLTLAYVQCFSFWSVMGGVGD